MAFFRLSTWCNVNQMLWYSSCDVITTFLHISQYLFYNKNSQHSLHFLSPILHLLLRLPQKKKKCCQLSGIFVSHLHFPLQLIFPLSFKQFSFLSLLGVYWGRVLVFKNIFFSYIFFFVSKTVYRKALKTLLLIVKVSALSWTKMWINYRIFWAILVRHFGRASVTAIQARRIVDFCDFGIRMAPRPHMVFMINESI